MITCRSLRVSRAALLGPLLASALGQLEGDVCTVLGVTALPQAREGADLERERRRDNEAPATQVEL